MNKDIYLFPLRILQIIILLSYTTRGRMRQDKVYKRHKKLTENNFINC